MAGQFNLEFDSRILRTSIGFGGRIAPSISRTGALEKVSCLNCGAPGGAVTADIPPAFRNDPGLIYICPKCEGRVGSLPLQAISFSHRKQ